MGFYKIVSLSLRLQTRLFLKHHNFRLILGWPYPDYVLKMLFSNFANRYHLRHQFWKISSNLRLTVIIVVMLIKKRSFCFAYLPMPLCVPLCVTLYVLLCSFTCMFVIIDQAANDIVNQEAKFVWNDVKSRS